jgi:Glu-tRNA(Gln) amidotransferase subunit E-like FAD-binding protein
MIEDHCYFDADAGAVRWNQNLLPNQCACKIVYFERHVWYRLDRLGIRRICIESHPLNPKGASSKSRHMYTKVRQVNLIRTSGLRGNSNVMIAPAIRCNRGWRFVVLS